MYIHQCSKCIEEQRGINNSFDVAARTYYKLKGSIILCHRHWHQADRPKPEMYGSYGEVVDAIKYDEKSAINKKIKFIR